MRCEISHVDTCLSCYVPDHRWIGVIVDCHTTTGQVLSDLVEEWDQEGEATPEMVAAFEAEMTRIRLSVSESLDRAFMPDLDVDYSVDDTDDPVLAWFTVRFYD